MASTVVGLFDDRSEAEAVVRELADAGFSRDDIGVIAQDAAGTSRSTTASGTSTTYDDQKETKAAEGAGAGATAGTVLGGIGGLLVGLGALVIPGIGPVVAAGPLGVALTTAAGAGLGAAAGGLVGALIGLGIPEEHANYYAEGVRRGGTLVTVHAEDANVQTAAAIMRRHGAVDIDKRAEHYRAEGFSTFDSSGSAYTEDEATAYRSRYADEVRADRESYEKEYADQGNDTAIPIVEEDIQIGKRQVNRGGVRVFSRVTETPVEKDVTLRDEEIHVERRPVNRQINPGDRAAFEEGEIVVTETDEEAVVSKDARVVEEVVVGKTASERTETVRDTVRKTDVEVEKLTGDVRNTDPNRR